MGLDATPLTRKVSGVGRYAYNLLRAYATDHPDTTLYLVGFSDDTIDEAYSLDDLANVKLYKLPIPRKVYQLTYRKFFRPNVDVFLKKLGLDILVCTNFALFPYTRATPSIVVVHDLAYERFPETIERKNLAYLRKRVPSSLKKAARIVAISEFTKNELVTLLNMPQKLIDVVPCGVSNKEYVTSERSGAILTVGTLEPRKNLSTLLDAYSSLPDSFKEAHPLQVVGASGWGDSAHIEDSHVQFLGYVSDDELDRLYSSTSLFVFPSIYEGFGLPLLESFIAGTPVIAADIPPFQEVAGNTISYFDPRSEKSIARALESYFTEPYTEAELKAARERALTFSWTHAAKQLEESINSALGK